MHCELIEPNAVYYGELHVHNAIPLNHTRVGVYYLSSAILPGGECLRRFSLGHDYSQTMLISGR